MDALERLIKRVEKKECGLQIRYDPEESGEQWGIKCYPDIHEDGYFYAYHSDLQEAARKVLEEMTW